MKKKWTVILLALLCLLAAALSACNGSGGGSGATTEDGTPILTIGLPQNANVTSYTDNAFTKYLEEKANVKLEFVYFPSSADDYIRKLTLMAASGEKMPDVLWGFTGLGVNQRNEYGEEGYFMDLTDLIEKYAPDYKAAMERLDRHSKDRITSRMVAEDGKIYAMPMLCSMVVWDDLQDMLFINQDWLDALGLEQPSSPDELYKVLKAFKDEDPNGNGIADEIPLFGRTVLSQNITSWIINAYVYFNDTYELNVTDGKLWAPFVTDEYREALIYLNKLCKEGLLSDLSFSAGAPEMKAMVTPGTGTAQVGIWAGHPSVYADQTSPILEQYENYKGLTDVTGKGGYIVINPSFLYFPMVITADCGNPEAAMRFLNVFYQDETITRQRHGEKDVDWTEEAGELPNGEQGYIKVLNSNAFFKGSQTWCANGGGILTAQNYLATTNAAKKSDNVNITLHKKCNEEILAGIVKPKEVCEDLIYTAAEYEERSSYLSPIRSYWLEQRNLFILGTNDPSNDADWNAYLNKLDTLGLQNYIDLMQKVYNENLRK